MKKLLTLLIVILLCQICTLRAYSSDLPNDLKTFLKKKYPSVVFKIDNSFTIKSETFLPLIPEVAKEIKKIEIVYSVPDKSTPKLILLSNNWAFAKLIKDKDGNGTILDIKEIQEKYKEIILSNRLPDDLVVPKGFFLKKEFANLAGEKEQKKKSINIGTGFLYLTSPDTGKIIYLDLNDTSMTSSIQTTGAPLEIAYDKTTNTIFVTDFAKDKLYKLKPNENSILKDIQLEAMSSPRQIELSSDGSLLYFIESLASDFAIYDATGEKPLLRTKLPPSPTSFALLKEDGLIAITCPATNNLAFLDIKTFTLVNQIMIDGTPEKVISDPVHNTLYLTDRNENKISIVDIATKKVKNTILVGDTPTSLAISPALKKLYVGNGKSNTINIIDTDTNQITNTITLPVETQFPGDLELTLDGKFLITTSETTSQIGIIDLGTNQVIHTIDVGVATHSALLIP